MVEEFGGVTFVGEGEPGVVRGSVFEGGERREDGGEEVVIGVERERGRREGR